MNYKKVAQSTAGGLFFGVAFTLNFVALFGLTTAVTVLTPVAMTAFVMGVFLLLIN